jgi:DNA-3-methyladenine glycosylase II
MSEAYPGHPTPVEIAQARAELARREPAFAQLDPTVAPFTWRSRPGGPASLMRKIVEQQVSTASAAAIWGRMEAGLGTVTPATVLSQEEAGLRAFGLSGQKVRYVRAIAEAVISGELDFDRVRTLPADEAVEVLTSVKGVGRWTAEVYLLMCEGRPDAWPAGDLALQEAWREAAGEAERPDEKALRARAEPWRPWRGVAAHLLWAAYVLARPPKAPSSKPGSSPS